MGGARVNHPRIKVLHQVPYIRPRLATLGMRMLSVSQLKPKLRARGWEPLTVAGQGYTQRPRLLVRLLWFLCVRCLRMHGCPALAVTSATANTPGSLPLCCLGKQLLHFH